MSSIIPTGTASSRLSSPVPHCRGTYAREAVLQAFGGGVRWVFDDPEFVDRKPSQEPRNIARTMGLRHADRVGREVI